MLKHVFSTVLIKCMHIISEWETFYKTIFVTTFMVLVCIFQELLNSLPINNLKWSDVIDSDFSVTVGVVYLGDKQGAGVNDVNKVSQTAEEGTLRQDQETGHQMCFDPWSFSAVTPSIATQSHSLTITWRPSGASDVQGFHTSIQFYLLMNEF